MNHQHLSLSFPLLPPPPTRSWGSPPPPPFLGWEVKPRPWSAFQAMLSLQAKEPFLPRDSCRLGKYQDVESARLSPPPLRPLTTVEPLSRDTPSSNYTFPLPSPTPSNVSAVAVRALMADDFRFHFSGMILLLITNRILWLAHLSLSLSLAKLGFSPSLWIRRV